MFFENKYTPYLIRPLLKLSLIHKQIFLSAPQPAKTKLNAG